jgi:hypothetical protein
MKILRSRLFEAERERLEAERNKQRTVQVYKNFFFPT